MLKDIFLKCSISNNVETNKGRLSFVENKYFLISFFLFFALIPLVGCGKIYGMEYSHMNDQSWCYTEHQCDMACCSKECCVIGNPMTSPGVSNKSLNPDTVSGFLKNNCLFDQEVTALPARDARSPEAQVQPFKEFYQMLRSVLAQTKG